MIKRSLFILLSGVWAATAQDAPPIRVPDGFIVERVAGPPLADRPMSAGFDERGRLYVCDSGGLNVPAAERQKLLPDKLRVLDDTDGDGRFDKSSVVADQLMFALGPACLDGAVYFGCSPSLWRIANGQREALVSKFNPSSSGNDIHSPVLGRDGRIYWTSGGFSGYEVKLGDGSVATGRAPRLWRCKPNGSAVERLAGGGMDNPTDLAFTEEGDIIGVTTFYTNPDNGRRDALLHWVEGVMFPKVHDLLKEFKNTGDPMPALEHLGPAAPGGVMVYRSPGEFHGNVFTAQFNMHKVKRHILERDGATFRCRSEDFLTSTSTDFHPTDVFEDADGSLLVVDTGGWYLQHCPTSKIAKPEILGGIYRVRRKDAPKVADARGSKLDWPKLSAAQLAKLLSDARFAVRDHAMNELAKRSDAVTALSKLLKESGADVSSARSGKADGTSAPLSAVWTLARIEQPEARSLVRAALSDKNASVRMAAIHVAGLHRDADASAQLIKMLATDVAQIRRNAATALGRIGNRNAVPALLDALRPQNDRFLEHSIIYALIQIADREGTLAGLRDESPQVRRGALIALDQMDGGNLTPELVAPLLDPSDPALQQTALKIITAHPTWAKEILGLTRQWFATGDLDETRRENVRAVVAAFSGDATMQELVAQTLREPSTTPVVRVVILEAMAQTALPANWTEPLCVALGHADARVVRQAVATVRATGTSQCDEALRALAGPDDLRAEALATVAPRLEKIEPSVFDFLQVCLDQQKPVLVRLAAAQALGAAKLNDRQLDSLAGAVGSLGAFELPKLLPAFARSSDATVGRSLIAALEKSPGLESVSAETLRGALAGMPPEVKQGAEPLLKRLSADVEAQSARLKELTPALLGGDARRGREVFFGRKGSCFVCHSVGGQGGRVGPDLSKVGAIRSGRDLLEAIVFPSATFVRGYEPFLVRTRDGIVVDGIIARETGDAIYLYGADRIERRVPRAAVTEMRQSRVSVMPQGLDAALSREELQDLIAFLMTLK